MGSATLDSHMEMYSFLLNKVELYKAMPKQLRLALETFFPTEKMKLEKIAEKIYFADQVVNINTGRNPIKKLIANHYLKKYNKEILKLEAALDGNLPENAAYLFIRLNDYGVQVPKRIKDRDVWKKVLDDEREKYLRGFPHSD
ncbi:MAG: hypothetical protein AABX48_01495 [Nanoarchaeota archaeon]